jgi:hypothetical protein
MERSRVRMGAQTALYRGSIIGLRGPELVAMLHSPRQGVRLAIDLDLSRSDGIVSGRVVGTRALSG